MKILLVVYRDNERVGGSLRVAEILASSLLSEGVDVYVVCAYGDSGRLKAELGDRCILMNSGGRKDFRAWLRYRNFVKRLSPDIVHYVDCVGWMTLAGIGLKPKRIVHQHSRPDVGPGGHKRFRNIRWLSGTADRVIAISEGAGRQLVEKCGVEKEKVSVIYNAVNPDYLKISQSSSGDRNTTASDERVLGMAIRVVEDKGVEDALKLLQYLPNNYVLSIAGDGPAREKLKACALELGVSDRLRWLGSVSDIAEFYKNIDYYLFMSWYEGFGLSVAEAMFCQKPVVGLLGDGEIAEPEYPLVNTENSLLINRSDPGSFKSEVKGEIIELLAKALLMLDENSTARKSMVMNAFDWVNERFTSQVQLKMVLKAYRKTIEGKF